METIQNTDIPTLITCAITIIIMGGGWVWMHGLIHAKEKPSFFNTIGSIGLVSVTMMIAVLIVFGIYSLVR